MYEIHPKKDQNDCNDSDQHRPGRYYWSSTALDGFVFTVTLVAILVISSAVLPGCSLTVDEDVIGKDKLEEEIQQHIRDHHKIIRDPSNPGHHIHVR